MYKVETFLKNEYMLGEGPHWDDISKSLLTVDITNAAVVRWDPSTLSAKRTKLPDSSVGAIVPISGSDDLLVAAKRRFATVNETSGVVKEITTVADANANVRFNDGKCDPIGRFIAGTMNDEDSNYGITVTQSKLYSLNRDETVNTLLTDVCLSNGLAWTSDGSKIFYIDSLLKTVRSFDYDITSGTMSNPQCAKVFDSFPDGMCIDANGLLYAALFFEGKVIQFDPQTGQSLREINIENCNNTTSVCFGGKNLEDLYVTSAHVSYLSKDSKKEPGNSGSLFKVTGLGVKGAQSISFCPQTLM